MNTKSLLLASLMLFFVSGIASAQITFQRIYGGTGSDYGHSIQQTTDGGYIVVGTIGANNSNVYLIKTDSNGDVMWTHIYGGSDVDFGQSVGQTIDGGYIIAGIYDFSMYVIKTNENGNIVWTKTYGSYIDMANSVKQTHDDGYIIVGESYSAAGDENVCAIKTNANGDTLWTKTYGGTSDDVGLNATETIDNGYIIVGSTKSFGGGNSDVYLIKIDSVGSMLWSKTYGGLSDDYGTSVQPTTDGGYIIGGYTWSFGAGSVDMYLIKTDAIGDTLWTKTYGGSMADYCRQIQETNEGGYIVVGNTYSYGAGSSDVYLVKLNSYADTVWSKTYGGSNDDGGESVQQTTDGGYCIAAFTQSFGTGNVYVIKTDANGNSGCNQGKPLTCIKTTATISSNPATIVNMPLIFVTTPVTTVSSESTSVTLCSNSINEITKETNVLSIFPNPTTTNTFTLQLPPDFSPATLQIFNTLGALVYEQSITQASTLISLNKPAGIYFVKVDDGDRVVMGKLIIQ